MNVSIRNEQSDLIFDTSSLSRIVEEVVSLEGRQADEVSLFFVDEKTICALHKRFFNDPSFTDCISFPLNQQEGDYKILGEIFVCPLAAVSYAESSGADPYDEVLLYIIHGLLHLMGYDDISPEDSRQMRNAESRHMNRLKELNLRLKSL